MYLYRFALLVGMLLPSGASAGDAAETRLRCVVVSDTAGCAGKNCTPWTPPTCPSGFAPLAKPTICGGGGTRVMSTPAGVMTAGSTRAVTSPGYAGCTVGTVTTTYATVAVDGVEMVRQQCSQRLEWSELTPAGECSKYTQVSASLTDGVSTAYGLLCCPSGE